MRTIVALVALLFLIPSTAAARSQIELGFLNSDFTFGQVRPDQAGWDLYFFEGFNPTGWEFSDGSYQADSGPLVKQTLTHDLNGNVIGSAYLYEGGTFTFELVLQNGNQFMTGSFVAQILKLEVFVNEINDGVNAYYDFGAGLFDANIAEALGIRRRTIGGNLYSDLLLTDDGNRDGIGGDHTTPVRQAWDGVAEGTLIVPEPASSVLILMVVAAWLLHVRSSGLHR